MNEFEYIGEWVEVKCANDGSKFIVDRCCWDSYLKDYKWISCTNKLNMDKLLYKQQLIKLQNLFIK